MTDYISRQAAIDAIEILLEQSEYDEHDKTWNNAIRGSINAVKHHVPSAPVREVKRGKKMVSASNEGTAYYVCPECSSSIEFWFNFCPYCGTDVSI